MMKEKQNSNFLTKYTNGNYTVYLLKDGTKIRINSEDSLICDFAESIDCTVTEKCDGGCKYCYLGCNENGRHADLDQPFFKTLHAGQELALNGNDLSHPKLTEFLKKMKKKGVICNITVSQKHFLNQTCLDKLKYFSKHNLIHGIGVSLTDSSNPLLIKEIQSLPSTVLHVIDGLFTKQDVNHLSDKNIKLLILGYKKLGRGDQFFNMHKKEIENNINYLRNNITNISTHFDIVSFDNLAINNLEIKKHFNKNEWASLYMGNEGQYTFYIDAVNKKFAKSSLSENKYPIKGSVDAMFAYVRKEE